MLATIAVVVNPTPERFYAHEEKLESSVVGRLRFRSYWYSQLSAILRPISDHAGFSVGKLTDRCACAAVARLGTGPRVSPAGFVSRENLRQHSGSYGSPRRGILPRRNFPRD